MFFNKKVWTLLSSQRITTIHSPKTRCTIKKKKVQLTFAHLSHIYGDNFLRAAINFGRRGVARREENKWVAELGVQGRASDCAVDLVQQNWV